MSAVPQTQNTTAGNGGDTVQGNRLLRILLIFFGAFALVAFPVLGYAIGNFLGAHMSVSDIEQGYAYSGLLYIVYNATHNPVYYQASQVSQGLGITTGQTDVNTLALAGLVLGLIVDVPIAYFVVYEYEKLRHH